MINAHSSHHRVSAIMPLGKSLPVIPNSTTTVAVIAPAASAAEDNNIISFNNHENEDFEVDVDYDESVEDDMRASINMTGGIPKNISLVVESKKARGTMMLRQASLDGNDISAMACGPDTITKRLLNMLPMEAKMSRHARKTLMQGGAVAVSTLLILQTGCFPQT